MRGLFIDWLKKGVETTGSKKLRSTSSTAAKTLGRLFNKKAKSSSCGSHLRQLAQYEQGIHLSISSSIKKELSSFLDVVNSRTFFNCSISIPLLVYCILLVCRWIFG